MFRKLLIFIICIACTIIFLSCGVEDYYFLPQVQANSISSSITNAIINISSIPDDPYYYASYYAIFYRIYASKILILSLSPTASDFNLISPNLLSDYNYFLPITNPANTSATISANTFKSRNFFELDFDGIDMLPKNGGILIINFPTAPGNYPTASLGSVVNSRLLRSIELISPKPDKYFRNSSDLLENVTSNTDVDRQPGSNYAYVAMYIVAVGTHPTNFTRIYSKPTFISVFKLPDLY